jgi:hypothetical protein
MNIEQLEKLADEFANERWPPETDIWIAVHYAFIAGYLKYQTLKQEKERTKQRPLTLNN